MLLLKLYNNTSRKFNEKTSEIPGLFKIFFREFFPEFLRIVLPMFASNGCLNIFNPKCILGEISGFFSEFLQETWNFVLLESVRKLFQKIFRKISSCLESYRKLFQNLIQYFRNAVFFFIFPGVFFFRTFFRISLKKPLKEFPRQIFRSNLNLKSSPLIPPENPPEFPPRNASQTASGDSLKFTLAIPIEISQHISFF